jgi:hypothetical protein
MSKEPAPDRDALTRRVKASLRKAQQVASRLRQAHTRLLVTGIASSAASTLVAGITAAGGPVVGEGTEGWRVACIVAAVFAFVSTVSAALGQQLKVSDRLSKGTQCVGRLRALDVAIATSSQSWEEIVQEYQEIANTYPEFIG